MDALNQQKVRYFKYIQSKILFSMSKEVLISIFMDKMEEPFIAIIAIGSTSNLLSLNLLQQIEEVLSF